MNLLKKYEDGGLRRILWEAAKAGTEETFHKAMSQIKEMNKTASDYLAVLDPRTWSYFTMEPSYKVEHVTFNFVESFNYWVDKLRSMTPMKLLDELRGKLAHTIQMRRTTADR